MDTLNELFLSAESLKNILVYMCNTQHTTPDPITESAQAMLSSPVQFSVSRSGFGILKGQPVFPFCYMSVAQRQHVYELIKAISGGEDSHSSFQQLEDPLAYTVENERIIFKRPLAVLDPKVVFSVLLKGMAESETDKARMRLLRDLLLQRIARRVQISRDTLTHIETQSELLFQ